MEARDLTHAEAVEAFKSFANEVGPEARVIVSLNDSKWGKEELLHIGLYPQGLGKDSVFRLNANTYAELLALAQAEWAKHADTLGAKAIRNMALKIISITADEGCCSELSLCKAFSPAEVKTYGDRACEEATRIGGNGPFSILRAASESEAA